MVDDMNKNHRSKKKLTLSRETIQTLSTQELTRVQGGLPPRTGYTVCFSVSPRTNCCLATEATLC
jgi:hypothetical protein